MLWSEIMGTEMPIVLLRGSAYERARATSPTQCAPLHYQEPTLHTRSNCTTITRPALRANSTVVVCAVPPTRTNTH